MAGLSLFSLLAAALSVAAPPFYDLQPGDVLQYERRAITGPLVAEAAPAHAPATQAADRSAARAAEPQREAAPAPEPQSQPPAHEERQQIQISCLARERDVLVLLVELLDVTPLQPGGPPTPGARHGAVLRIDRRGRRAWPEDTLAEARPLRAALEALPIWAGPRDRADAWLTPFDFDGQRRRCWASASPPDEAGEEAAQTAGGAAQTADSATPPAQYRFRVAWPPELAAALGRRHAGRLWANHAQGHIERVEVRAEYAHEGRAVDATIILHRRLQRPPAWAAQRAAEMAGWLEALRSEQRLRRQIIARPQEIRTHLDRLERVWSSRLTEFAADRESPFAELARQRIERLRDEKPALLALARYAREHDGQVAPHWSLEAADGRRVTSEEFRRGPVIECLWSLDDPGFMTSMAAFARLHALAARQGAAVLCLNVDRDAAWAAGVLRAIPVGGPLQILARPLVEREAPPALPHVRWIDTTGRISGFWLGWQASYPEIEQRLRELR